MVELAREEAAIRPVEKDQEDFEYWCRSFGVRNVARADFYCRRIDMLPQQIDHLKRFVRTLEDIDAQRRQQAKSSPRDQALLASQVKAAVWRLHGDMQGEMG